jgi:MFS family permease
MPDAGPAGAPPAAPQLSKAERQRTATKLVASMTAMMLQYMLTSQVDTQIWLNHYNGDFGAQAKTASMMMSLLMTGGFFFTPILGALSDAHGRKLQLILPPLTNLLQRFVLIYTRDVRALFVSFVIGGTFASAGMGGCKSFFTSIARALFPPAACKRITSGCTTHVHTAANALSYHPSDAAAVADLYADDPVAIATASSRLSLGPLLAGVIGPVIGSRLAAQDMRLPYAVSAVVAAMACGLVAAVPETLPESARTKFTWKGGLTKLTPLSCLKLFQNGRNLALLTVSQLISNLGGGVAHCHPSPDPVA